MGGVAVSSPVSAANTNSAFLEKNADDATIGRVGLNNSGVDSGTPITNAQAELNGLDSYTGNPANNGYNALPAWTHNEVGLSSDNLRLRADKITHTFNGTTGVGHSHGGTDGDGALIPSLNV